VAAPISGGGRPPLDGTTRNDRNTRSRWRLLAHVRVGERRRSCVAACMEASMAHLFQRRSPTESTAANRIKRCWPRFNSSENCG